MSALTSEKRFQSASLIRCSISARKEGGGYSFALKDILDADAASDGKVREIMRRCAAKHISGAKPGSTFILLGLDAAQIEWTKGVFANIYGKLISPKPTTYRSANLSWVHVTHLSKTLRDSQFERWCEGKNKQPKVVWARDELAYRSATSNQPTAE